MNKLIEGDTTMDVMYQFIDTCFHTKPLDIVSNHILPYQLQKSYFILT